MRDQAIAYLNVDIEIRGNFTFMAESLPLLYPTIWSAAQFVKSPHNDNSDADQKSIYEYSKAYSPSNGFPHIGYDNAKSPFLQLVGVPSVDYYYDCKESHSMNVCPKMGDNDLRNDGNLEVGSIDG